MKKEGQPISHGLAKEGEGKSGLFRVSTTVIEQKLSVGGESGGCFKSPRGGLLRD